MKRIITALLLSSMLLSLFASCASTEDTAAGGMETANAAVTTAAPEAAETKPDYLASLERVDFGGADYTLLCREEKEYEMFAESEIGEPVNDAVYKRNQRVSEYYNINFSTYAIPGVSKHRESFLTHVRNSVLGADMAYDAIAAHLTFFATAAMEGHLMNLYNLDGMDLENPWWASGFVDSNTVNGKLYLTTGDLAFSMYESLYAVFFSKQLAEDHSLPDLYALVDEDGWTMEKLSEFSKLVSRDVNGDSRFDNADSYGLITNHHCARVFLTTLDLPIMARNDEGTYDFVFETDRTFNAYETVYNLLYNSGDSVFLSKPAEDTDYTEMLAMFGDNRALFYTGTFEYTSQMRVMDMEFGIIPFPKYDEAQEDYITHAYGGTSVISVPAVVKDEVMSAMILEAMAAESGATTIPAFYDNVLQTKFVRDENSARMLEMIAGNVFFDFGYIHSQYMDSIFQFFGDSLWNETESLASAYAKKVKAFTKGFEKIMEKYEELE